MIRYMENVIEMFVLCILNRSIIGYDHAEMDVTEKCPVFLFRFTGYVTAELPVIFILHIFLPPDYLSYCYDTLLFCGY